jgi:ABC-type molybdate transport system substrate-binding protein
LASTDTALGYYSEEALISAGGRPRIADRISHHDSIDKLLSALDQDEVQLAMVFASTITQRGDLDVMLIVPEDLHEDIRYKAAAAASVSADPSVVDFLRFIAEDADIQQKLNGYGLLDRAGALEETR